MKKEIFRLMLLPLLMTIPIVIRAQSASDPIITIHSTAFQEIGSSNRFSIFLGSFQEGKYVVEHPDGQSEVDVKPANFNPETAEFEGTWIPVRADANGIIKVYGDPLNLNVLSIDGAYIDRIDFDACTNLQVISLQHNVLKSLDLTPFTNAYAIYLTDNPFTPETPLVVGAPKPYLSILEVDIIDHISPALNLSDYPSLITFDGYHTPGITECDPSGCPDLMVLSLEMTSVSTLDVTHNPKLVRLNISESRIKTIDLSGNPRLNHLIASHTSGTINTDVWLTDIDLSPCTELTLLDLCGNYLPSIDLSGNPALTNINLKRNLLSSIDLSANTELYSVDISFNNLDFNTMPVPRTTWGEYYYKQREMPVARQIGVGEPLDLSSRVIRPDGNTSVRVFALPYGSDDIVVSPSLYTYENGTIRFKQAMTDSVYIEYSNTLFPEYPLVTTPMAVKSPEDIGKPSKIITMSIDPTSAQRLAMSVGMAGATSDNPRRFSIDFGDGKLIDYTSTHAGMSHINDLDVTPPAGFNGQLSVYIPEGDVMTAFAIDGTTLYSLDVTRATELASLSVTDCGLYEIDLKYNRCLTYLNLSGNNLYNLDLTGVYGDYEKNVLTTLILANNNLSSLTVISKPQLFTLDISHNKFAEFSLKDFDGLKEVNLSHNLIQGEFSLSYQNTATSFDLSHNNITSILIGDMSTVEHFDITSNDFALTTLPLPADLGSGYVYAPQNPVALPENAPGINLSDQNRVVEGIGSTFSWIKADGTVLTEGVDYTCANGNTKFLKSDLGKVFCRITNPAFPQFEGENALTTTLVNVLGSPSCIVARFTTTQNGSNSELVLTGHKKTAVYIDWKGDGSELLSYPVETQYIPYDGISTYAGAEVRVYTYDSPQDISVFSISDTPMADADFSALTNLVALGLYNTGLAPENLRMPVCPSLSELSITGAQFVNYPYAADYQQLRMLNLASNHIEHFDASAIPSLQLLALSDNGLVDVDFDNPSLWNVMLSRNKLESIDLSGLPALEQLDLGTNRFSTVDLSAVSQTLRALSLSGNKFNFATLPLASSMPNLMVYYYTAQAPVEAVCNDGMVDLGYLAVIDGYPTAYAWYKGEPTYDEETGEWVGDLLAEGTDYTISDGVTEFMTEIDFNVVCLMTNELYPSLTLHTVPLSLGGIAGISSDDGLAVDVFSLTGICLRKSVARSRATYGLAPGLYIVGGRKVLVRENHGAK